MKRMCRYCRGPVRANYDHVGNCDTGECDGTYEHVCVERHNARPCPRAGADLGHRDIIALVEAS